MHTMCASAKLAFVAVAALLVMPMAAQAQQKPDLATFERWGFFGVWKIDCKTQGPDLPDGQTNWEITNARNPDGSDSVMSTTRRAGEIEFQSVISSPVIASSGNLVSLYTNVRNGNRLVVTEEKSSGGTLKRSNNSHPLGEPDKPLIRLGRFVDNNRPTQWFERCSATPAT